MSLRSVLEADAYDDHGAAPQPALSLTEIAYRRLEEAIVTLSLRPGAVLTEAQLIDMGGVGRTPVREALIRLAQQGLVEVLPRKGVVVAGGGGDNAAARVGVGVDRAVDAFVTLGTSGVLFVVTPDYQPNAASATHAFCSGCWPSKPRCSGPCR